MCCTAHGARADPDTSLAECLVYRLLTLQHPCQGADPSNKLAPLLVLWLRSARRRSPSAVVRELLHLASDAGARYMPAHRLALHWLFGICGVGPFGVRAGGLGWDMLLAALSCVLGYHSVVLAASPNDNGLLHQELVWAGIHMHARRAAAAAAAFPRLAFPCLALT